MGGALGIVGDGVYRLGGCDASPLGCGTYRRGWCRNLRCARDERIASTDIQDRTEKALAPEPIDRTDANDPIDPIDKAEPTDPTDRTEPFEAMDSTDSSDHSDKVEVLVRATQPFCLVAEALGDRTFVSLLAGATPALPTRGSRAWSE